MSDKKNPAVDAGPSRALKPSYDLKQLQGLYSLGARFVQCRADKRPVARGWNRARPSAEAVAAGVSRMPLVGLVPASVGLICIDVDEGGVDELEWLCKRQGVGYVVVQTQRGWHLWARVAKGLQVGNKKWGFYGSSGDLRHSAGFAVLWDLDAIASFLSAGEEGFVNTSFIKDLSHEENRVFDNAGDGYRRGDRNNSLNRDVYRAVRAGRDTDGILGRARGAGLPEKEIRSTVVSAAKAAGASVAESGKRLLFARSDEGALESALESLGVEYFYNVRGGVVWVKRGDGAWERMNDMLEADLIRGLAGKFGVQAGPKVALSDFRLRVGVFVQFMRALLYHRQRDVFRDWLEDLPSWDGKERLETLLIRHFGAADDEYSRWAARYLIVGAIQRTMQPGCKLDEIPVLIGGQGIGKSHLLRGLLPDDRPEWFSDSLSFSSSMREQVEAMEGRVIVENSEMQGARSRDLERLKSFLSRTNDNGVRGAYQRYAIDRERRCVFVGTSNRRDSLPNDPSGNRRFVPVMLRKGIDVEKVMAEERLQLWSEGWQLYADGAVGNLPRELHAGARKLAEDHRVRDDVIEDAISELGERWYQLGQILEIIGVDPKSRAQQARVKGALEGADWTYGTVRAPQGPRKRWINPEYDQKLL